MAEWRLAHVVVVGGQLGPGAGATDAVGLGGRPRFVWVLLRRPLCVPASRTRGVTRALRYGDEWRHFHRGVLQSSVDDVVAPWLGSGLGSGLGLGLGSGSEGQG